MWVCGHVAVGRERAGAIGKRHRYQLLYRCPTGGQAGKNGWMPVPTAFNVLILFHRFSESNRLMPHLHQKVGSRYLRHNIIPTSIIIELRTIRA